MKRRDFIKTSTALGFSGLLQQGCSSGRKIAAGTPVPGFDIHPFVKAHPEAVFIAQTGIQSKNDADDIRSSGFRLARELIVQKDTGGYPFSTKITVKPNWTETYRKDHKPIQDILGVNTDPNFVEGWLTGMRETGCRDFYLRECSDPTQWPEMGYRQMADRHGFDLTDLSTKDYWELDKGDIRFIGIPDGVMFKKMGFMAPMNEPGTFLVNIAKFKAHGMGITATIKNLQGICGRKFHYFCNRYDTIRKSYDKRYLKFMHGDFDKRLEKLYAGHLKDGIPRWDKPGMDGGIWMETWVQRMLDSYSVTPTGLNIVEGIYSQDGDGFGTGPHEKMPSGYSSRDYMSNVVIFGVDPFRVDIITHWMGGHEPGNFGLFHIGMERGLSDVLDPRDIPVYTWSDGRATVTALENLPRTPLVTYYLRRDYNGQNEPKFHCVDEPFDYTAWKTGKRIGSCTPSIRVLGQDAVSRTVMELELPKRDSISVDVVNRKGEVVWRLIADDLEPGVHQVVWDRFDKPGMHGVYVKGMGWDVKKQCIIRS